MSEWQTLVYILFVCITNHRTVFGDDIFVNSTSTVQPIPDQAILNVADADDVSLVTHNTTDRLLYIVVGTFSCCICLTIFSLLFCSTHSPKHRGPTSPRCTSSESDALNIKEMATLTISDPFPPPTTSLPIHLENAATLSSMANSMTNPSRSSATSNLQCKPFASSHSGTGTIGTIPSSKRPSMSTFSGVDSQGIDIDDASHHLHPQLYSIPEAKESSIFQRDHQFHAECDLELIDTETDSVHGSIVSSAVSGVTNITTPREGHGFIFEFVAKQQAAYHKVTGNDVDEFATNLIPAPSVLSAVTLASMHCKQFETNDMIPGDIPLDAEPDRYSSDEEESLTQSTTTTITASEGNPTILQRMRLRARMSKMSQ